MSAALKVGTSHPTFQLNINTGPDQGKVFQLNHQLTTLGRELGNDIVLKDPKVSRSHLQFIVTPAGIQLKDLTGRDSTLVNGKITKEALLQAGDKIQLGGSALTLQSLSPSQRPSAGPVVSQAVRVAAPPSPSTLGLDTVSPPGGVPNPYRPPAPLGAPKNARAHSDRSPAKEFQNPKLLYKMGGAIFVLILYTTFFSGEETKVKKTPYMRSKKDLEKSLADFETKTNELETERLNTPPQRKMAHDSYQKGFRDFQKENYTKAIESFQAALAADPQYDLAQRYYQLALRKREQAVDYYMNLAQRYYNKSMFSRCVSYAEKARVIINQPNSLKFKEATDLSRSCSLQKEVR